jgi:hypothetical protein
MVNYRIILTQENGAFVVEVLCGMRILSFQDLITCSYSANNRTFPINLLLPTTGLKKVMYHGDGISM